MFVLSICIWWACTSPTGCPANAELKQAWVPSKWPGIEAWTAQYSDVIMSRVASQITSHYSGIDQRKHQSSASLASVRGVHRWPANSPHKGQATRKMFPFDDVIMLFHFQLCGDNVNWSPVVEIHLTMFSNCIMRIASIMKIMNSV